jgi:hypothetical protein
MVYHIPSTADHLHDVLATHAPALLGIAVLMLIAVSLIRSFR